MIGDSPRQRFTVLCHDLIRAGAHDKALGSDGFVVMAYLLSWGVHPHNRVWETSASEISRQLGWGSNRERARRALVAAEKDGRLIKRHYFRDGALVERRHQYVVCAGGRKFEPEELLTYSQPIVLDSNSGGAE
ncbi:hypothetical protein [Mycobacterium sp. BK086]|uniref:hypothetical protein n=1 Tax=Mycobacterium sp. BK086 TaxID=2512165 RepID=UPI001AAD6F3B|nr:hypothetical protein [Mycobacterium sp. BK086]